MKTLDYENLKEEDLKGETKIRLSRDAFSPKHLHCDKCNIEMRKSILDMDIPNLCITIHFEVFRCPKCGKEYLNGEQAERLDEILKLKKIISNDTPTIERAGNFDGSNYFVRFPAVFTKMFDKKVKAEIKPLSATDYFVHFKKK